MFGHQEKMNYQGYEVPGLAEVYKMENVSSSELG